MENEIHGYYESKDSDLLESIDKMLRNVELEYNVIDHDDIEFELPNNEYTTKTEIAEKYNNVDFSIVLVIDDNPCIFEGTSIKNNGVWTSGGELDSD